MEVTTSIGPWPALGSPRHSAARSCPNLALSSAPILSVLHGQGASCARCAPRLWCGPPPAARDHVGLAWRQCRADQPRAPRSTCHQALRRRGVDEIRLVQRLERHVLWPCPGGASSPDSSMMAVDHSPQTLASTTQTDLPAAAQSRPFRRFPDGQDGRPKQPEAWLTDAALEQSGAGPGTVARNQLPSQVIAMSISGGHQLRIQRAAQHQRGRPRDAAVGRRIDGEARVRRRSIRCFDDGADARGWTKASVPTHQ